MMQEFQEFQKIARLNRDVIVTEKIDGTSGVVYIVDGDGHPVDGALFESAGLALFCGSRSRWVTPDADNHGFARWVMEHREALLNLGPGRHFGEWWGQGIQRGYGLQEKRWSLFNVTRWCLARDEPKQIPTGDPRQVKMQDRLPACCGLVPVLWRGPFLAMDVVAVLADLVAGGSRAAPGYCFPEGIVVYHTAGNVCFKMTLGNDGNKGAR